MQLNMPNIHSQCSFTGDTGCLDVLCEPLKICHLGSWHVEINSERIYFTLYYRITSPILKCVIWTGIYICDTNPVYPQSTPRFWCQLWPAALWSVARRPAACPPRLSLPTAKNHRVQGGNVKRYHSVMSKKRLQCLMCYWAVYTVY